MTRLFPRSLRQRWWLLIALVCIFTLVLALGLERYWVNSLQGDALTDPRFWIVLSLCLFLLLALSFWLSRRWLQSITQIPTEAISIRKDTTAASDPYLEEAEQILGLLLAHQKQNEEEMTQLRNFVANASHELRTPLTTLKLRVEALQDGAMDDRVLANKFLSEMESEIDHLSHLVADMLDLSRIEATKDTLPLTDVNLSRVVSEVCEAFHVRAEKSEIQIQVEAQKDLPTLRGVEDQIRRLVYNLIDNAIKYTPNGGWVKVRLTQQSPASPLVLEVEDNGFGIPPNYLPHIFERFYRAEATRPRYGTSRGSGLGLAIVKAIVDSHGGKITVHSEVGKGSLFRVEFPSS